MPTLGLLAIGRFIIHIVLILWRKEAFRGLFLITLATIASGTWFYRRFEPSITTWVDAYYFTVITLTTIGYGDMGPTTSFTKLFTTVYVFIGLGIIAGLIGLIGEAVIEDSNKHHKRK
ncbi:MAG: potassium channel family protein [Chloroflexota bacterium]